MKPQDILFLTVSAAFFLMKKPRVFVYAGIFSLLLAIPLFAKWIFFTAERLTWYAAAFFLIAIFYYLFTERVNV